LFSHSPVDAHFNFFQFEAIMNKATVNIHLQVHVNIYFMFLNLIRQSEFSNQKSDCIDYTNVFVFILTILFFYYFSHFSVLFYFSLLPSFGLNRLSWFCFFGFILK
jgi:hypothetical protein